MICFHWFLILLAKMARPLASSCHGWGHQWKHLGSRYADEQRVTLAWKDWHDMGDLFGWRRWRWRVWKEWKRIKERQVETKKGVSHQTWWSCRMVCSKHLRTVFRLLKAASEPQKLQARPLAFLISNESPRHLMMQTTLFIGPVDFYWTDRIWAARRVESCCVAFYANLVEGESFLIILEVLKRTNDTSKDDHSSILVIVIQSNQFTTWKTLASSFCFQLESANFQESGCWYDKDQLPGAYFSDALTVAEGMAKSIDARWTRATVAGPWKSSPPMNSFKAKIFSITADSMGIIYMIYCLCIHIHIYAHISFFCTYVVYISKSILFR